MSAYPKINTIYKRDERGQIVEGEFSCPEFEYLAETPWLWTEKVDGTNIRLYYRNGDLDRPVFRGNEHEFVKGRSDNAQIPPFLLNRCVELLREAPLEEVFADEEFEVVLYGEGYGAKIQKGGGNYIPDGCDFVLFDVAVGPWWLRRPDVEDVGLKLGIRVVPLVMEGTLADACDLVRKGFDSEWPNVSPEGLVGRPSVDLFNRKGERIITKIKARDFK